MNASTEARLKIRAGQKHFPLDLVARLLAERDGLNRENIQLKSARVSFIGGHYVKTENGAELCEPVLVVEVER